MPRADSLAAASEYLFEQYDIDADGYINQFDFSLFLWDLKTSSKRPLTKEQAQRCWQAVDLYSTGRVNAEEFKRGMALLWNHDFYVTTVPDLYDVDELPRNLPSSPSSSTDLASASQSAPESPVSTHSSSSVVVGNGGATMRRKPEVLKLSLQKQSSLLDTAIDDLVRRITAAQHQLKIYNAALPDEDDEEEDDDSDDEYIPALRVRPAADAVESSTLASTTAKRTAPNTQRFLRVHMEDSYKTIALLATTTAGDLVKLMNEKLELPTWEEGRYALYESDPNAEHPVLREVKKTQSVFDLDAKGKRIHFREVSAVEQSNMPLAPKKPEKRKMLFGFLVK